MTLKEALKLRKGDAVKPRSGYGPVSIVARVSAGVTVNADGSMTKTIYIQCTNGETYRHREAVRVEDPREATRAAAGGDRG